MLNDITHEDKSLVFRGFGGLHEFVIEVIGADGVRQFAEVHLEQGGHRVDVLQHGAVVIQIWHAVFVKRNPEKLNNAIY